MEYMKQWRTVAKAANQDKLADRLAEVAKGLEEEYGRKAAKELLGGANLSALKACTADEKEMSQAVDALGKASDQVKKAALIGGALPKAGVSQESRGQAARKTSDGGARGRYRDAYGRVRRDPDIAPIPPIRKPDRTAQFTTDDRDAQGRKIRDEEFEEEKSDKHREAQRRAGRKT